MLKIPHTPQISATNQFVFSKQTSHDLTLNEESEVDTPNSANILRGQQICPIEMISEDSTAVQCPWKRIDSFAPTPARPPPPPPNMGSKSQSYDVQMSMSPMRLKNRYPTQPTQNSSNSNSNGDESDMPRWNTSNSHGSPLNSSKCGPFNIYYLMKTILYNIAFADNSHSPTHPPISGHHRPYPRLRSSIRNHCRCTVRIAGMTRPESTSIRRMAIMGWAQWYNRPKSPNLPNPTS